MMTAVQLTHYNSLLDQKYSEKKNTALVLRSNKSFSVNISPRKRDKCAWVPHYKHFSPFLKKSIFVFNFFKNVLL